MPLVNLVVEVDAATDAAVRAGEQILTAAVTRDAGAMTIARHLPIVSATANDAAAAGSALSAARQLAVTPTTVIAGITSVAVAGSLAASVALRVRRSHAEDRRENQAASVHDEPHAGPDVNRTAGVKAVGGETPDPGYDRRGVLHSTTGQPASGRPPILRVVLEETTPGDSDSTSSSSAA